MVDVAIPPINRKKKYVGFQPGLSSNTRMFEPQQAFVYGGQQSLTQILCGMFSYIHYLQWQWPGCSRFPANLGPCTIHEAVRYGPPRETNCLNHPSPVLCFHGPILKPDMCEALHILALAKGFTPSYESRCIRISDAWRNVCPFELWWDEM